MDFTCCCGPPTLPPALTFLSAEGPPGAPTWGPLPPSSFTSLPACAQPRPRHGERGDDPSLVPDVLRSPLKPMVSFTLMPPDNWVAPLASSHCVSPYPDHCLRALQGPLLPPKMRTSSRPPLLVKPQETSCSRWRTRACACLPSPPGPHRTTVTMTSSQEERTSEGRRSPTMGSCNKHLDREKDASRLMDDTEGRSRA